MWGDSRSCSVRRTERVPDHLRQLYAQIADSRTEEQRSTLQRSAWSCLKAWRQQCDIERATESVRSGRVLAKSKKLHTIKALVLPDGSGRSDVTEKSSWAQPLKQHVVHVFEYVGL